MLFTKEFYGNCYKALREDGIMINQHESPFYSYEANAMKRTHRRIREIARLRGAGALLCSLGAHVLRAETAAVYGLAVLGAAWL